MGINNADIIGDPLRLGKIDLASGKSDHTKMMIAKSYKSCVPFIQQRALDRTYQSAAVQ